MISSSHWSFYRGSPRNQFPFYINCSKLTRHLILKFKLRCYKHWSVNQPMVLSHQRTKYLSYSYWLWDRKVFRSNSPAYWLVQQIYINQRMLIRSLYRRQEKQFFKRDILTIWYQGVSMCFKHESLDKKLTLEPNLKFIKD